jgi:phosphoribosylformimino-5-aminoimidazole carboxamide ribotide isomerase
MGEQERERSERRGWIAVLVIPAVDLREGACVQLVGGAYEDERVRLDEPLAVARRWREAGFRSLHVVDLDAATRRGDNRALVGALLAEGGDVQVGGGVRDQSTIAGLIADGATRVVIGTRALEDPTWLAMVAQQFPGRIVVAVDSRNGRVTTHGWTRTHGRDVVRTLAGLAALPLAGALVTSVEREGRMEGPDLELSARAVEAVPFPVHASGGIATPDDLRALASRGIAAAVLGMALYTGALDARAIAEEFA